MQLFVSVHVTNSLLILILILLFNAIALLFALFNFVFFLLNLLCYNRCAHFAIYDGHGGRLAAEYAQKHLHKSVLSAGLPRELVCLSMHSVDCSNFEFSPDNTGFLFNLFGCFLINNVTLLFL